MYADCCDSKGQILTPPCGPCSVSFAKNAMKRKCRSSLVREIIVLMAGSPSFHPLEAPSLPSYHQAFAHQKRHFVLGEQWFVATRSAMKLQGRSIWMNQQHLRQKVFQKHVMLPIPGRFQGDTHAKGMFRVCASRIEVLTCPWCIIRLERLRRCAIGA